MHRAVLANERGQNLIETLLHVGVGERAVRRLKCQANRNTHCPVRNALALIEVEYADGADHGG